jgi:hypothetical protein
MQQDETALVKEALRDARDQLAKTGRVLPATYMLVTRNPQTGALLTFPTALAAQQQSFASQAEYLEYLGELRAEAQRLGALAIALAREAQAEIEGGQVRRVLYLRVEDREGIHQLHAPIERTARGLELGALLASSEVDDGIGERLLTPS